MITRAEIMIQEGEDINRALKRLQKQIYREGLLKEIKKHMYFRSPSEIRRMSISRAKREREREEYY